MATAVDRLMQVVEDTGIWKGELRTTHKFILSPSVYVILPEEEQELRRIGYAINDCYQAISHIAEIAFDNTLNYSGVWATVRRILSVGVSKHYHPFLGTNRDDVPNLIKVDIMVDSEGNYKIAEIDGHNKHGMGYSTLGKLFRKQMQPDAKVLSGTIALLADYARGLGHKRVILFYAHNERFYIPEFRIAQAEFARHGIECTVIGELEARPQDLRSGLFIDLPQLNDKPELYRPITVGYMSGDIEFIIPPKPYFGAKTLLGFLRNDLNDPLLEGLLTTFIKPHALDRIRQYIPETLLVGKNAAGFDEIMTRASVGGHVLKRTIASGMRGVIFSDDPRFAEYAQQAASENLNWVLQREVVGQTHTFTSCEDPLSNPVLEVNDDWQVRLTAHYVASQLADITVTARRDKAVHGAKDCLQMGVIID